VRGKTSGEQLDTNYCNAILCQEFELLALLAKIKTITKTKTFLRTICAAWPA